jgi:hypothetical protein
MHGPTTALVLPFVGMLLAACVYVSLFAAVSAVRMLKHQEKANDSFRRLRWIRSSPLFRPFLA